MLRNRVFYSILRQRPLQASTSQSPLRIITRSSPFLRPARLHRRPVSTSRVTQSSQSRLSIWRTSLLRRFRNDRHTSNKYSPPAPQEHGSQEAQSLSDRFKQLSRKYGWAAVGVYFGLSVLDFPFCFLAVRLIGPDRIGEVEHTIVDGFWSLVGILVPSMRPEKQVTVEDLEAEARETHAVVVNGHHTTKEEASIWTQLLLAYGVHKSLIFFRVPLTAAVTPKIVKTLRGWGWNIGKQTKKVTQ